MNLKQVLEDLKTEYHTKNLVLRDECHMIGTCRYSELKEEIENNARLKEIFNLTTWDWGGDSIFVDVYGATLTIFKICFCRFEEKTCQVCEVELSHD
jgi:hypothetical protein